MEPGRCVPGVGGVANAGPRVSRYAFPPTGFAPSLSPNGETMSGLLRRKTITAPGAPTSGQTLARTLSWPHLVALGVGAIVGTGILTLIGVGADRAGPAVLLSFAVAGAICACAALCYAEMATMIPASGSAYTYSYAVLGEIIAWVVGWSLILEYSLVVSAVAVGWSSYAVGFLRFVGVAVPESVTHGPTVAGDLWLGTLHVTGWGINVPAVFIIAAVAGLLTLGTKESARINTALVVLKIATLALFVAVALPHLDAANFAPFAPHGFGSTVGTGGVKYGVMGAAAIIFFAFYGFDAISTAAEEAKNPERDLAIGIVGSMAVCTVIYMVVAAAAIGAARPDIFGKSAEPLALILRQIGQRQVAGIVGIAAAVALPTVILGFLYGQSRIFLVMARDGFLPPALARISTRGTPVRITLVTAVFVGVIAALIPARRHREPCQCRHVVCVRRGRRVCAGAPPPKPRRAPPVPRAGGLADRACGNPGVLLSLHQPAERDAGVFPDLERDRARRVFRLRTRAGGRRLGDHPFAEPVCDGFLVQCPGRERKHHADRVRLLKCDRHPVQAQEQAGHHPGGALVAIVERVVTRDTESISRRQSARIVLAIGMLVDRSCDGGFEQTVVLRASPPAMFGKLTVVDGIGQLRIQEAGF